MLFAANIMDAKDIIAVHRSYVLLTWTRVDRRRDSLVDTVVARECDCC